MQESSKVKMIERVTVMKFDKTSDDNPAEPCEVICQETATEVTEEEAALHGYKAKPVEASTIKLEDK